MPSTDFLDRYYREIEELDRASWPMRKRIGAAMDPALLQPPLPQPRPAVPDAMAGGATPGAPPPDPPPSPTASVRPPSAEGGPIPPTPGDKPMPSSVFDYFQNLKGG